MRIFWWILSLGISFPACGEEGLWTFDHFPSAEVAKAYGVKIDEAWLDHIRLSTLRLTNCTAVFVSGDGLILTNHHCIESCLAELSFKDDSLLERGFVTAKRTDERRCATQLADVLVSTEDVTAKVVNALQGLGFKAANEARKKLLIGLEADCEHASARRKEGPLKCQAVTLNDAEYSIYKYQHYQDLRLAFAPEGRIAAFGGDPDNFEFPRWSLDFALLRAYDKDRPARTPNHLQIDFRGPQAGELVFVAGNPGFTERRQTRSQLEFERDIELPAALLRLAELHGRLVQFADDTTADRQLVEGPLDSLENNLKVRRKLLDALHDDSLLERRSTEERELRARVPMDGPDPWNEVEKASERERDLYTREHLIEGGVGFNSILFRYARLLLRAADERAKPNSQRLREYTDASLPRLEQLLFARIPVHDRVEELTLSSSLARMRDWLGPDDPIVHRLLIKDSPASLATRLVAETKLDDPEVRLELWQGGKRAVDASLDPMIELARSLDGDARSLRREIEDEVEAPVAAASLRIAEARRKVYGAAVYPDANFTLRLNYGTVQGWTEKGASIGAFSYLDRAFERASGVEPFALPDSWLKVKDSLDLHTPFCLSTSNDIVGGNSGSPLIDSAGHLVGLTFDGNIHSIAGAYWFDAARNRAVSLHPAIIRLALEKVYGAQALLQELSDQ